METAIFIIIILILIVFVSIPAILLQIIHTDHFTNSIITDNIGGPIRGYYDQMYTNNLFGKKINMYIPSGFNVRRTYSDDYALGGTFDSGILGI